MVRVPSLLDKLQESLLTVRRYHDRFYTNLPGYDKNWLWRGDDLWNDRWEQVLYLQPEWVEIISWNDYGESHYIGPIVDDALGALTVGEAPFDYVSDYPHDGWRRLLPFYIDMYTVRGIPPSSFLQNLQHKT